MKPLQHPIIFLEEKIHRKNNQLLIKFDYDETLISLIRSIQGTSWSKSLKAWYILNTKDNLNIILKLFEKITTVDFSKTGKSVPFKRNLTEEQKEFNLNPIDTLLRKDYLIENSMKIFVMYRVLSTCRDIDNEKLVSTLGYPITISTDNNTIACNNGYIE